MTVYGIQASPMSNVISAMQARRFLRKGYEAFLALVLDSKRGQMELENIMIVREFSDVFPKELPIFHLKEKWIYLLRFYQEQLLFPEHPTGWL